MNRLFAAFVAAGLAASPAHADNVSKAQDRDVAPAPAPVQASKPVDAANLAGEHPVGEADASPAAVKPVAEGSPAGAAVDKSVTAPEAPRR